MPYLGLSLPNQNLNHNMNWIYFKFIFSIIFQLVNISMLKLSSDRELNLALLISFQRKNKRSTAALDGMAVLFLFTVEGSVLHTVCYFGF